MRTLILGGTSWLGGVLAEVASRRGHLVTCLARGESGSAPDAVRWIRADRRGPGAYDAVRDDTWDAVLDVGRQPMHVRSALAALAGRARHWAFVSTGSVYADDSTAGQDESAPLHAPWTGAGEAGDEDYGPAKVACERACQEALPAERLLVARAGLIAGYGDLSDRFGYWPARLARGGEQRVLLPPRSNPVQVIDVKDLAAWLVHGAENAVAGVLNAVGNTLTLSDVLAECQRAAASSPVYVEADQDWLIRHEVSPWSGPGSLPLWLPLPEYAGFMTRSNAAARAAGLRLRPLSETAADALAWERRLGLDRERKAGLGRQREADLLSELAGR
ncbi:MAG: NAD-dependent epimerase/dehydratase [uncultured Nocardioidaceae bacterium]|uniref:NAD-dependent epimerase/dehydratase n=1 Tax=uncultured Nocardioidaceae bacterium TaxID=253824 RepID=A0A6J4LV16_9ACTN|nr:MAG: NAD-dependent epimerase/dehydratase [uncultured Nocardioidaceae bacterium]